MTERASILIDAEAYFGAVASALTQARRRIMILAWDIDPRVKLVPRRVGGRSLTLRRALLEALERSPKLEIFILRWGFLSRTPFGFRHPRIHYVVDDCHPFGASQHQKIVTIDDELAFTGGLDLCLRRWDTRRHRPLDRRRRDPNGRDYLPFHDVQWIVSGGCARDLAELARKRWWLATGERLSGVATSNSGPYWPSKVCVSFARAPVAISRTCFEGVRPVREIERLFIDSIRRARRYVYIENQYFTSRAIVEAIRSRLTEPNCPEFLVLLPKVNSGWLEESTMGILRRRRIRELRALDLRGRVRFYYPTARVRRRVPISLHSKLMVVDDELIHAGSANLSNRSMGLDSECDLSIVATGRADLSLAIARVRDSLLAEHLGTSHPKVRGILSQTGSLFAVVDRLGVPGGPRELIPHPLGAPGWIPRLLERIAPGEAVLDPERPVDEHPFFSAFLPRDREDFVVKKERRMHLHLALLGFATGVAAQLRFTPARRGPIGATGILIGASALNVPTDIALFVTAMRLERHRRTRRLLGRVTALGLATYLLGRASPGGARASGDGFWPCFLVHANLLAPVHAVSFRGGQVGADPRGFFLGTLVGQLPRVLLISGLASAAEQAARRQPRGWLRLAALTLASAGLLKWSSRKLLPTFGSPRRASADLRPPARVPLLHPEPKVPGDAGLSGSWPAKKPAPRTRSA